jgi:hydrogenase nickel incorporation protein HypA/HybF
MHEFSMAKELVNNLLAEAERNRVIKIVEVNLEIGEVSFLQEDQLKYSFDIIKKEHPVMREAELTITKKALVVKCPSCDYQGPVDYQDDRYHFMIPLFRCPECDSGVTVLEGKDIIIRNIEAEVKDDDE